MPLQSNGLIRFSDIKTEFGGSNPVFLSEYYNNSPTGYVSNVSGIASNGNILMSSFFGKQKITIISNPNIQITNGTQTSNDVYTFTNSGTINLTTIQSVDILIVGGGGAGGWRQGGGGGGGGIVYQKNIILNSGLYNITVGNGGATSGNNGGNSEISYNNVILSLNGIVYQGIGGGYGGGVPGTADGPGNNGGSGGGGQGYAYPGSYGAGSATQGNTFFNNTSNVIGGSNGTTGGYYNAGNGGGGFNVNITGISILYGPGGYGWNKGGIRTEYGAGGVGGDVNNNGSSGNKGIIIFKINVINLLTVGNAARNNDYTNAVNYVSGDDTYAQIGMNFVFNLFGVDYGSNNNIYWNSNHAITFGTASSQYSQWGVGTGRGFLFGQMDRWTNQFYVFPTTTNNGYTIKRFLLNGTDYANRGENILWEFRLIRGPTNQYIELRVQSNPSTVGMWYLSDLVNWINVFGNPWGFPVGNGGSLVLQSDLNGNNWTMYTGHYVNI